MLKERISSINLLSLYVLACFPVLPMKITVALIIVFTAVSIISGTIWREKLSSQKRLRELILLAAPFLLILFRTGITDRSPEALFYLEVSLSLIAFPVAFFMNPFELNKKQRNNINYFFAAATILVLLFGEGRTILKLWNDVGAGKMWPDFRSLLNDVSFGYYFRTYFEEFTGIHPTYASVFAGISILVLLDSLLKSVSNSKRTWLAILLLVLLFLQVMLASRTPFLGTMLTSLLLIFLYIRRKVQILYALGGIVVLSAVLIMAVPSFTTRFNEINFSSSSMPDAKTANSFNIRFGIYKCSTDIIKNNWLWGIGPANVQPALNDCYNAIDKEVYDQKNYNTHNQFFDYWAGLGIPGPLLLLVILIYTSVKSFRSGNPVMFCISILFLVAMLTENLLNRQNGIVTFAFFISMYFFTKDKDPLQD